MLFRFPIDIDGLKIAAVIAVLTVIISVVNSNFGWIGSILTVCCLLFFRDPERVTPVNESAIISPADGTVQRVCNCIPPDELGYNGQQMKKVSVFMSVFNVHVNRSPVSGVISKIIYTPGKFFNATLDKSSVDNEREAIFVKMNNGQEIAFVRIAGLIARRIRTDIAEGEEIKAGQRVGIIRFGSRVDMYLPVDTKILVEEGQTLVAGESIIANLEEK